MNGDIHRGIREMIGSYALGHLDGTERLTVQAHLDGCASCRAELAELTPVVNRLVGIDPDRLDATPTPPPDLGDKVVAVVRAEREAAPVVPDELGQRRRRRGATLVAAAAAAVVFGAGTFWAGSAVGPGSEPTAAGPFESVPVRTVANEVDATAGVVPHTWGVEVKLEATGFVPGGIYRVVVLDDAGRPVSAGEFVGTGDQTMNCNLNSSVLRQDAAGFEVTDEAGAVVLSADL